MLEKLRERLQAHRPSRSSSAYPQAAVLLPIVARTEPTLLFTQRTAHLSQHAGQVAFPGGKREPEDSDLLATALRETQEEIALAPERVEVIGRLSDVISLYGLRVTPFVGVIAPDLSLVAEPGEIEAIFEVPLRHFVDDCRSHTDVIPVDDQPWYVPSYPFEGRTIWGLSAMMLVELLAVGFECDIALDRKPAQGELRYHPQRRRQTAARSGQSGKVLK
ncbi:MAG: CoA pyrophosphatase [Salinicola sp.]|uniref:CoA pyrophosphatase n=1 Tax=uncultured Salinicola sp. TaxID=1193542 RepID=UPI000C95BC13|nr:CoA pyrophosphatase [uncultured Salinicola sp.]MAM57619.1 CoA pyrophosphatase [Salinicola sp.]|tara:strand:- start:472 stop:1128 length:657 start_codon:yes stop_codon:yes gene_type:complete